ncbi:MAG TPA: HAMP domain-containing sensor histidine kinase, partial [Anaerolineales bacterium]|nr:HAMP domain-containing sensor histidine kinase [Anaerolineales bacterium]
MRGRWAWLTAVIPASLGISAAFFLASGAVNNLVIRARVDLGTLSLLAGLALSALLALGLALHAWHRRTLTQTAALAQAQAANERRRFLQRLDHELKNPLTAIRAGLANVADASDGGAQREAMSSVEAQVKRVSRLTADLRKLAELEMRPLERSSVNLAELLQQVVEFAQDRPEAEDRRLTLTLPQAPWPLPAILGDRDLLLLVIHNLLDNALKFTRPGDTIEVRAFEDGDSVVIEVADTGPGIADEDLPHVWEELYRGKSARGAPGSGLGLALVQAILLRHGGQVTLRSRA